MANSRWLTRPSTYTVIDFETASEVDLRKTGITRYATDPSTVVTVFAWKHVTPVGTTEGSIHPFKGEHPPRGLVSALAAHPVIAHNAEFEYHILRRLHAREPNVWPLVLLDRFLCTAFMARFWGLPASLEGAGEARQLHVTKDSTARDLMLRMSRPRAKKNGVITWWHEGALRDPALASTMLELNDIAKCRHMLADLTDYCEQDVAAEDALFHALPMPLAREHHRWHQTARCNLRGVPVDLTLMTAMMAVRDVAQDQLQDECQRITNGAVRSLSAPQTLLKFIQSDLHQTFTGISIGNLRSETVDWALSALDNVPVALRTSFSNRAKRLLHLRRDYAKASLKKLDAIANRQVDGRIHDILVHYGANRTGRWTSAGPQLQNAPRPALKQHQIDSVVRFLLRCWLAGKLAVDTIEGIEALFAPELDKTGGLMDLLVTCLRSVIAAPPGRMLAAVDLSQIEARMLAWLAGQMDVLDVFARGEDVYTYAAERLGNQDRQLGKVATLSLGYQAGGLRFQGMAEGYGLHLSEDESNDIVRAWRTANSHIVDYWYAMERAAKKALRDPGTRVPVDTNNNTTGSNVHFMTWKHSKYTTGMALLLVLPSGRPLVYQNASLVPDPNRPGREQIKFWGVNQQTRRWELQDTYGGKLVENATQAASRDVMAEALDTLDNREPSFWNDLSPVLPDHVTRPNGGPYAHPHSYTHLSFSVHDSGIMETDQHMGEVVYEVMMEVFRKNNTDWNKGLPLDAEGGPSRRFAK